MELSYARQPADGKNLGSTHWGPNWPSWARAQTPAAEFVTLWSGPAVHGLATPRRVGGVVTQPADTVLGIRGWEDCFEGTLEVDQAERGVPFALFEVEKIVRMMLHQSGLAFEILASSARLVDTDFPARRIVDSAVTAELVTYYRDVAAGGLARLVGAAGRGAGVVDVCQIARQALVGVALCGGQIQFEMAPLVETYADARLGDLLDDARGSEGIDNAWVSAFERCVGGLLAAVDPAEAALPDQPRDYDWLNDFVVDQRRQH